MLLNCITINTDASYHPTQKVGGYAFYIVCDNFKIQFSGAFKSKIDNPINAELMCIANALSYLLMIEDLPKTQMIVVNSDCVRGMEKIGLKSNNKYGRIVAQKMRKLKQRMAYRQVLLPIVEYRHVKAHTNITDSRSWVNDWCDKNAKIKMRTLLKKN